MNMLHTELSTLMTQIKYWKKHAKNTIGKNKIFKDINNHPQQRVKKRSQKQNSKLTIDSSNIHYSIKLNHILLYEQTRHEVMDHSARKTENEDN